jgi:hypothetical protein
MPATLANLDGVLMKETDDIAHTWTRSMPKWGHVMDWDMSHPYFKNKIGCIKDSYVPQE